LYLNNLKIPVDALDVFMMQETRCPAESQAAFGMSDQLRVHFKIPDVRMTNKGCLSHFWKERKTELLYPMAMKVAPALCSSFGAASVAVTRSEVTSEEREKYRHMILFLRHLPEELLQ